MGHAVGLWRLRHNTVCDPTFPRVKEIQASLQARQIAAGVPKNIKRLLQLVWFWAIFRVENDEEFAACELQRVVARPRFRPWLSGRDDNHLEKTVRSRCFRR